MKTLLFEITEANGIISTHVQYNDGEERFNRLEILGLLSNLLVKLSNDLDKPLTKKNKKTK